MMYFLSVFLPIIHQLACVASTTMTEMALWCAVYGEASKFRVTIARDADVATLRETIFTQQLDDGTRKYAESSLTLYLARDLNGVWLKADDDQVEEFLRGEIDPQYKKLLPGLLLSDPEYFGENFGPGDGEIHVLVALPEGFDERSQAIRALHAALVQSRKRKHFVHDEMSYESGVELLQELGVRVESMKTVAGDGGESASVEPFKWEGGSSSEESELNEQQLRERYRAYVEENIGGVLAKEELCVLSAKEDDDDLLRVQVVPGHDIELSGRANLLILNDVALENPSYVYDLHEVKMLVEVKRTIEFGAIHQVISKLIALDLLTNDRVMALLTDLDRRWEFIWVAEKDGNPTIQCASIKDPGQAFHVIRSLLAYKPPPAREAEETRLPYFGCPVKRRKLDKMLPGTAGGNGVRAALQRYFDVASVTGPDIDLARETANRLVRSMPQFRRFA